MTAIQSVAEAEQLVKQLYRPGQPKAIQQINDELQRLQVSPDGWKLADELMASDDPNVRFFAALTFTVKLNNEGSTLDSETAQTVLTRLIHWLVRLVQQGEGGLVCKKLCSTLTTYFIRSPVPWPRLLLHVAQSLAHGDVVGQEPADNNAGAIEAVLPKLGTLQLKVLTWLAGTLADDVGKIDANSASHARIHKEMEWVVVDASSLMRWAVLQTETPESQSVRMEALRTFLTWVNYAQPVWPRNPELLQYLRDLIEPAARGILDNALRAEALDIFRDILESYTSFLEPTHVEMMSRLIRDHIGPALTQALSERDPQYVPLGQLIIAFGCAYIQQIVERSESDTSSGIIVQLHLQILSAPGYPGDEDELSIQSIEFWNTYIEYINDTLYSQSGDKPAWAQHAQGTTQQAIELLWKKMWIPPPEVKKGWTDSENEGFREFRLDASDLMLSMFVFLGSQMAEQLISYTLQSLEGKHWPAVEASLVCLNALADNILESSDKGDVMQNVFRSTLFRDIADFSQTIPLQTRRTAIDLLGFYGAYIESHAEFLPDTLRFLFASLEVGSLANAAAKSIGSLCSECRGSLTGELDGFLAQYQRFLESPTAEPYTKEKVVGAIAAIIQAISPESGKARPLLALVEQIEKDIVAAKEGAARGDGEMAESAGVTALECLASIGKGLQVPEDVPIALYDDDETAADRPNYWSEEQGQALQQRIIGCFSVLGVVGNSSAGIEAACQVLRSGLTETVPGPFVLPSSVMVSFLQQCSVTTPQLESVLSTAGMLITQHSRTNSKRIDVDVAAIYGCILGFVQTPGLAAADPVVAMASINVFTRLMPNYTHILFGSSVSDVLDFTISAIRGADTFPKRAATEFWTKMIKPQEASISPEVQQRIYQVMGFYGPRFTASLVHQFGGQAQRSELDFLCEPLRALLLRQPSVQNWLQQSLTDASFPGTNVSMEDRGRFLRQLSGVRSDARRMKELVRAFWAACRGTVVSYSS